MPTPPGTAGRRHGLMSGRRTSRRSAPAASRRTRNWFRRPSSLHGGGRRPPDVTDVSVLGVRESDGQSIYRKPGTDRYCTIGQLDTEGYLLRAAARTMRPKMTDDEAADALGGSGLSEEQLAAAQMLLSTDRPTIVFVGPAGTGKSFTLAAMARAYIRYSGQRVVATALAQNAVRVLQGEGIEEAYTIADFLGQLKDGGSRGHIEIGQGDILVIH